VCSHGRAVNIMANQFECTQDGCDFMVRANSEDEVIQHVREHAQDKHGMSMQAADVRSGMESV